MNIEQVREEIPDIKWFKHIICDACTANDWYCPSDCDFLLKAGQMPFEKIQQAFARHDGDLTKVIKYIKQYKIKGANNGKVKKMGVKAF